MGVAEAHKWCPTLAVASEMEQLRTELIAALAEAGRLSGMENLVSEPYKTRYEAREVLVSPGRPRDW